MWWFFFAPVVFILVGCWRAARAVHHRLFGPQAQAQRRLARGSPTIADRAVVTLTGIVRAASAELTAPLSGRPCVAYHAVATLYGFRLRHRVMIAAIEEHRLTRFELEIPTDGNVVVIDGDRADFVEYPAPTVPRDLQLERRFVVRHGHSIELARDGGFEETTIAVGDRIRVQGMVVVEAQAVGEQGYRGGTTQIRLVAHVAHPITIGRA